MDVERIIKDSEKLSVRERAFFARYLISTLDEASDEKVKQAWLETAHNRALEIKYGEIDAISESEFFSIVRSNK